MVRGLLAPLAAWVWCCDPARVGDVPALVGRVARRLGHGSFDDTSATWQVEGFWIRLTLTRLAMALTLGYGMLPAALHHRTLRARIADTRLLAALYGLGFHFATEKIMQISFCRFATAT